MPSEKFEKEYFDKNYQNYNLQNPVRKNKALITLIEKYVNHGVLLDIGCAYGNFLKYAKKEGFTVYGCDISKYAVQRTSPFAKTNVCSITSLKYPHETFDIVTVFDVIEHIDDLKKAFSELKRVTKKEGIIMFMMPVYDGFSGKIVRILDKDPTHINKFSRYQWINLLKETFQLIDWLGVIRYFFMKRVYIHYQSRALRLISPAIIVVVRNL